MTHTSPIVSAYQNHPSVRLTAKELAAGHSICLDGLAGSALAVVLSALEGSKAPLVCVMNDIDAAGYLYADLTSLLGEGRVLYLPSSYRRAIKYGHIDPPSEVMRAEVMAFLAGHGAKLKEQGEAIQGNNPAELPIIVTYPSGLIERVIEKDKLESELLRLKLSEHVGRDFLRDLLLDWGFKRVDYVYEPGQFAIRGSIVDVFSYARELPYRIDFFDEEIESLRLFEVESQLSVESLKEVVLMPNVGGAAGVQCSMLSLLPQDTVFLISSYSFLAGRLQEIYNEPPLFDDGEGFSSLEKMQAILEAPQTLLEGLAKFTQIRIGKMEADRGMKLVPFNMSAQPPFRKHFDLIVEQLDRWHTEGYNTYLAASQEKQIERLLDILEERAAAELMPEALRFVLHEGFTDSDLRLALITDHQIFDRYHKYNLKSDKARSGKVTLSLKELYSFSPGDYIVHVDHGIGLFGGLITTQAGDRRQEVVKLVYRNNDVVFVSLHSLHKLSRYRSKGDGTEQVKLSQIGSGAWQRLKDRTKKKVKDIARDLIRLYAARREATGFPYSPDSLLQHELEASFMYEDTPDQERATNEVKADMEKAHPMDRLICGDVGFGKTEVAIRAAFKAIYDGKQVAVLVPTTVLAYQHFETFSRRLKDFPARVEYISRARTAKEIKQILALLADGTIDIIIGTHRLVSKDIKFKDLGLLIIDEEQKFGVAIKEKLRQLQVGVDTLTMSATPIPRTLQFSLMGARDLTNINTPPPNRYPVETALVRFSPDIIREAINFELSRSGQVFLVHNRIQNIEQIADIVRKEVPDARIAVGHGQMKPTELEKLLLDFNQHEYDVLIATTIIENGIDVPNANTIIINDAHRYGLAELHQLRGRVGRSSRKAFCFLITPPLNVLTDEARRRLEAIESFSDLGSGIRLALQDLDIRGAGNVLGAEQSGFIADLGYETYQKVFEEAVSELKATEFSELYAEDGSENASAKVFVVETVVESDLELSFPSEYVPLDSERILLYRELDSLNTSSELEAFRMRMQDRFGPIPNIGEELIRIPQLRHLGRELGIEKVILRHGKMSLHLVSDPESPYYKSPVFDKLLAFSVRRSRSTEIKERNGRRLVRIAHIPDVATAINVLSNIISNESASSGV